MEIERKFLVEQIPPNLDSYPSNKISQGYLVSKNPNIEERVRKKGNKFFFTRKTKGFLIREEEEEEISEDKFLNLWNLTENKRIEKIRYEIGFEKFVIEIDIYNGNLEGLITAEVEFDSEEEAKGFLPPPWFGREVTEDDRYKNRNLAYSGIPKD